MRRFVRWLLDRGKRCAVCDGEIEPWVVTVTGDYVGADHWRYDGVDYYVHGASYERGATTLWLAPAEVCGE